jgi:hypothetical protein
LSLRHLRPKAPSPPPNGGGIWRSTSHCALVICVKNATSTANSPSPWGGVTQKTTFLNHGCFFILCDMAVPPLHEVAGGGDRFRHPQPLRRPVGLFRSVGIFWLSGELYERGKPLSDYFARLPRATSNAGAKGGSSAVVQGDHETSCLLQRLATLVKEAWATGRSPPTRGNLSSWRDGTA